MIYTNITGKLIGECMTGFGINYPIRIYNSGNSDVLYTLRSNDTNFLLSNSSLLIGNGETDFFDVLFNATVTTPSGYESSIITISSESIEDGSTDPSGDISIYITGHRIVDTTGGHIRYFRALRNYDPNNGLNFPGINLGLTYFLDQVDFNYQRKNKSNLFSDAKFYISTFCSATTTRNLSTKKYPFFGLEISRTKQLNGVLFHIAAIDLYQDQALRQKLIQDGGLAENQYRSGISTGVGFKMGSVNFASSIGTYLYDPINYYNRVFHRHEISYAFKERWSLGINLKAHTYIANFTDIRLKYQLK